MRIRVDHTTHYAYDAPVRHSAQYLRLVPAGSARQRVIEWRLETPGSPIEMRDGYGNILHLLTLERTVTEILIRSTGVVETSSAIDEAPDEFRMSPLVFLRQSALAAADPAIVDFAEPYRRRCGTLSGLRELAAAVLDRLPFQPGVTEPHTAAAEAFQAGNGVCQDHAHVLIACCRHLGVPARYVSGYLCEPRFSDTHVAGHAWAEAWVVDRWRSFDVTNGGPAGDHHVRVAVGADYLDAAPVRGVRSGGGGERLTASALVRQDQQ
jgi:transglutaminase-like putative cysteine protease